MLLEWFRKNQRPLPWRENRDPYRVWISETMLQQTTSKAVIPYYERFLRRFPNVQSLARAKESDLMKMWAGLGYYSRARNLHKAAKVLAKLKTFPSTHNELLKLPGFGPYTARAVSSIAFGEPVGVLDGNVIRVLTRWKGLKIKWWEPAARRQLQSLADEWVQGQPSHEINQALMELGATICSPKNPSCLLCPLFDSCLGRKKGMVAELPLKRPRRAKETWVWQAEVCIKDGKVALTSQHGLPFLKKQLALPGQAKRSKAKPKSFDYTHVITHHDIYVLVKKSLATRPSGTRAIQWVPLKELAAHAPASLVRKAVEHAS